MNFLKSIGTHIKKRGWIYIIVSLIMVAIITNILAFDPAVQIRFGNYLIGLIALLIIAPIGDTLVDTVTNYQNQKSKRKKQIRNYR